MPRNPAWSREELILALELYFRVNPLHASEKHPEIVALSQLLNALPLVTDRPDATRFRNANGVYMKLCNFLRLDPSYHGAGLDAGGKLEEDIWREYAGNRTRLTQVADAVRLQVGNPELSLLHRIEISNDEQAPEGALLLRLHKCRERSQSLVAKKKAQARQSDPYLRCEVCGFSFRATYGDLGNDYIECHHTKPLSSLRPGDATRLADLVLVCANCHRMLHRAGDLLDVVDLSAAIAQAPADDTRSA